MATSSLSYNLITSLHHAKPSEFFRTYAFNPLSNVAVSKHNDKCSFTSNIGSLQHSFRTYQRSASEKKLPRDLIVYATPETAQEGLFSFLPGDNPWFAWIGGLLVALPFAIKKLINLTNQVEAVAEAVEDVADRVGKVADEIDKAADEMVEKLPDGTLKNFVDKIDDIAEATSKEAQKVEDLMDKVEEVSNKVEDFIEDTTSKQPDKATSTTQKS